MAALSTQKLVKTFGGVHAVDHVSLSFEAGKITALVGPNGSGKTTFINTVTGMLAMDGGSVTVPDGRTFMKIRSYRIAEYGITRTFQSVRVLEQISVLDNVLIALTARNVFAAFFSRHTKAHLAEAERLLTRVGLAEKRDEHAENLSYGQRKLLEIARALAMNAEVYFFDEPFAGLFAKVRETVADVMRELRASGKAVVLVEHDMDVIHGLSDYCYVFDSGKVIAEGQPKAALAEPQVVEAYLGK
ncbi:MAG: ABC transporter ATP-binding protein [Patescibacteria group bacterium]|nr:ABC transporter ATP-binding protein [Patescibacteria group bacterium]